jgi:hypothetical protein
LAALAIQQALSIGSPLAVEFQALESLLIKFMHRTNTKHLRLEVSQQKLKSINFKKISTVEKLMPLDYFIGMEKLKQVI